MRVLYITTHRISKYNGGTRRGSNAKRTKGSISAFSCALGAWPVAWPPALSTSRPLQAWWTWSLLANDRVFFFFFFFHALSPWPSHWISPRVKMIYLWHSHLLDDLLVAVVRDARASSFKRQHVWLIIEWYRHALESITSTACWNVCPSS
jgi:hypothetical protein